MECNVCSFAFSTFSTPTSRTLEETKVFLFETTQFQYSRRGLVKNINFQKLLLRKLFVTTLRKYILAIVICSKKSDYHILWTTFSEEEEKNLFPDYNERTLSEFSKVFS